MNLISFPKKEEKIFGTFCFRFFLLMEVWPGDLTEANGCVRNINTSIQTKRGQTWWNLLVSVKYTIARNSKWWQIWDFESAKNMICMKTNMGDCGATFSPQLHCNQDLRPQPPILKSGTTDNVCREESRQKSKITENYQQSIDLWNKWGGIGIALTEWEKKKATKLKRPDQKNYLKIL